MYEREVFERQKCPQCIKSLYCQEVRCTSRAYPSEGTKSISQLKCISKYIKKKKKLHCICRKERWLASSLIGMGMGSVFGLPVINISA